jgi:hypothetical protein
MKSLVCLFALSISAASAIAAAPQLQWETTGLIGPESALYDAATKQIYVSNMGTHGKDAAPGDGFIARLSPEGKMLEQKWVTGLENPKGLAVFQGHLYVGDDVYLWKIDIGSGKVVGHYKPDDGPGDFNDCTVDSNGTVYVHSGRLHTVFRLHEGKFEAWVKLDSASGGVNGLRAEKDRLLVGGWSLKGADGKEEVGHISTISFADKSVGRIGTQPICHIDGLEPDGVGGYTTTDWLTGEVFHVSHDGKPELLMTLVRGSADHAYRVETEQLIIPLMNDNVVRAYHWKP